jgi:hypothetical protein
VAAGAARPAGRLGRHHARRGVPPRKQYELARLLDAPTFATPVDHLGVSLQHEKFRPALLDALASVAARLEPARAEQRRGASAGGALDACGTGAGSAGGRYPQAPAQRKQRGVDLLDRGRRLGRLDAAGADLVLPVAQSHAVAPCSKRP